MLVLAGEGDADFGFVVETCLPETSQTTRRRVPVNWNGGRYSSVTGAPSPWPTSPGMPV
jgi:hypothetical protein